MMKYFISLLGAFLICGAHAETVDLRTINFQSYSIDRRWYADSTQDPYSAVVALRRNSGENFCTGTLTADGLIVTAVHCVFEPKEAKWFSGFKDFYHSRYGSFTYEPGIRKNSSILPFNRFTKKYNGSWVDNFTDWVILKPKGRNIRSNVHLEKFYLPKKAIVAGYGCVKILSDHEIENVQKAYARFLKSIFDGVELRFESKDVWVFAKEVADGKIEGVDRRTFKDTDRLKASECWVQPLSLPLVDMLVGCQAAPGNSGGPVFVEQGGKWFLYGVFISGYVLTGIKSRPEGYLDGFGMVFVNAFIGAYNELLKTINGR